MNLDFWSWLWKTVFLVFYDFITYQSWIDANVCFIPRSSLTRKTLMQMSTWALHCINIRTETHSFITWNRGCCFHCPPVHQISLDLSPRFIDPATPSCNLFIPLTWPSLSNFPPTPHSLTSLSPYLQPLPFWLCVLLSLMFRCPFYASSWNWDSFFCFIKKNVLLHFPESLSSFGSFSFVLPALLALVLREVGGQWLSDPSTYVGDGSPEKEKDHF